MPREHWLSVLHRDGGPVVFSQEVEDKNAPKNKTKRPITQQRVPVSQLALSVSPPDLELFPATNWFRDLLERDSIFLDPKWNSLRNTCPPGANPGLKTDGSTMPLLAFQLQKKNEDDFHRWIKHVRTGLRNIETIEALEQENDHHVYFEVTYKNDFKVTSSGLSEGTLRLIALTLIPYLLEDQLPKHLVIEQPEDGIHPRALETILHSLRSIYDCQVWVSTQSPLVLAQSEVEHVLCASIGKDGSAEIVNGLDHPRLRDWKGSVDLGTLLATGVLG